MHGQQNIKEWSSFFFCSSFKGRRRKTYL